MDISSTSNIPRYGSLYKKIERTQKGGMLDYDVLRKEQNKQKKENKEEKSINAYVVSYVEEENEEQIPDEIGKFINFKW